jgi:hypothetical protein
MDAERGKGGGFEQRATSAWRSVRRHLPEGVAEAIRVPSKKVLRRLGLISGGKPGGSPYQR